MELHTTLLGLHMKSPDDKQVGLIEAITVDASGGLHLWVTLQDGRIQHLAPLHGWTRMGVP
jgi:hypothetical protein